MLAPMFSTTLESSARIKVWLEGTSSPQAVIHEQLHRKRKWPLDEMSSNISTPKRNRTKATTTSSSNDENLTPRPSQHPLTYANSPPAAHSHHCDPPLTASESSHASWASSDGKKRKRGGSPAKKMAGLRYARYPTTQERFSRLADLPCDVRMLAATMHRLGKGVRVIPGKYKEWLAELGNGDSDDFLILDREGESESFGETPTLDIARRIISHASRNDKLGCAEAAWNASVHSTLLDEAWYCSAHRHAIRWDSM